MFSPYLPKPNCFPSFVKSSTSGCHWLPSAHPFCIKESNLSQLVPLMWTAEHRKVMWVISLSLLPRMVFHLCQARCMGGGGGNSLHMMEALGIRAQFFPRNPPEKTLKTIWKTILINPPGNLLYSPLSKFLFEYSFSQKIWQEEAWYDWENTELGVRSFKPNTSAR